MSSIKITVEKGVESYLVEGLPVGKYDLKITAQNAIGEGSTVKTIDEPEAQAKSPEAPVVE